MDLKHAQALLVEDTRTRMSHLIAPWTISRKAEILRDLCRLFQALAICKLIVDSDVDKFRENLTRSGHARRYYLLKSKEENNVEDRFLGLSRVQSMFDTLVAGELELAKEIASISIDEWHDGWEYEDDFCYYLFIHRLVLNVDFASGTEAAALLTRFENALEGQPSSRLALCKALRARSVQEFRPAFESFLEEFRAATERRRARITEYSAEAAFWPSSFVCIEGLAWLRLGGAAGVAPPDEFSFCPAVARDLPRSGEVPDLFESLEIALKQS